MEVQQWKTEKEKRLEERKRKEQRMRMIYS